MRCGKPIKDEYKEYCSDCAKRTSHITQGRSLWLHKEPVSTAIYKFKYNNKRSWGELFAAEMAQAYKDQVIKWGIEEIIPIPLHKSRKRKRGYNQAEIIAKCLVGKDRSVSSVRCFVSSEKKRRRRKKLDRQERMGNLRDAFALSERWKPVANVLLIDDIYTTGATVEQAAKILKKAEAQNVYFLTISIGQGI